MLPYFSIFPRHAFKDGALSSLHDFLCFVCWWRPGSKRSRVSVISFPLFEFPTYILLSFRQQTSLINNRGPIIDSLSDFRWNTRVRVSRGDCPYSYFSNSDFMNTDFTKKWLLLQWIIQIQLQPCTKSDFPDSHFTIFVVVCKVTLQTTQIEFYNSDFMSTNIMKSNFSNSVSAIQTLQKITSRKVTLWIIALRIVTLWIPILLFLAFVREAFHCTHILMRISALCTSYIVPSRLPTSAYENHTCHTYSLCVCAGEGWWWLDLVASQLTGFPGQGKYSACSCPSETGEGLFLYSGPQHACRPYVRRLCVQPTTTKWGEK